MKKLIDTFRICVPLSKIARAFDVDYMTIYSRARAGSFPVFNRGKHLFVSQRTFNEMIARGTYVLNESANESANKIKMKNLENSVSICVPLSDVARAFNVFYKTVYSHVCAGSFPAYKRGKRWVVSQDTFNEMIARGTYILNVPANKIRMNKIKMKNLKNSVPGCVSLYYIARAFDVCYQSIYNHARAGSFPVFKYGRRWVVSQDTFNEMNARGTYILNESANENN